MLTGASATVVVRIFGPEIEQLQANAAAVKKALEGIEGTTDIQLQSQVLVPQVEVQFQPDLAAPYGLTPGDVRRAVDDARAGHEGRRVLRPAARVRRGRPRRAGAATRARRPIRALRDPRAGRHGRAAWAPSPT